MTTSVDTIECGQLIACAGVGSDAIARQIGGSDAVRIVPFRGDYYRLAPRRRDLVRGLIYPVPDSRFPFLGAHFTPRVNGDVWLGRNAVLALGAEAYRRSDVDLAETLAYIGYAGFRALRRSVPELRLPDLLPALGYPGSRDRGTLVGETGDAVIAEAGERCPRRGDQVPSVE